MECIMNKKNENEEQSSSYPTMNDVDDPNKQLEQFTDRLKNTTRSPVNDLLTALIVGAGPAGLCMASLLKSYGKNFHLIDIRTKFDDRSKATGLHRNTLKLFDKLNLIDEISHHSIELNANMIYAEGQHVKTIQFAQGKTDNDKNISICQDSLETILAANVSVQFGNRLISFEQNDSHVTATMEEINTKRTYDLRAQYLIACDGAKSVVREGLQISFDGKTTPVWSCCFDAIVKNPWNHSVMAMHRREGVTQRLVVIPIPNTPDSFKFHGNITDEWYNEQMENGDLKNHTKTHQELANLVYRRSDIEIDSISIRGLCFYHTASKIASTMRENRIFLIRDAAHVFLPNGGYGLNCAIEDAFSLAWRLCFINSPLFYDALFTAFNEERLQNPKDIQDDSIQKKQDITNLQTQICASKTEFETQTYNSKKWNIRLESILPVDICQSITSSSRNLAQIIDKNMEFILVLHTTSSETLVKSKQLLEKLNCHSPLRFELVHVCCTQPCLLRSSQNEECFAIADGNKTFFEENPETSVFIRPDNFVFLTKNSFCESNNYSFLKGLGLNPLALCS